MTKIKTLYAYLFFFLYNSVNIKGNILIQPKTLALIVFLEGFMIEAIRGYLIYGFPNSFHNNSSVYVPLIYLIPLVLINLWFFERNKKWEKYLTEFNTWSKEKQSKWNWIMRFIVFFIIGNLIFSLSLFI